MKMKHENKRNREKKKLDELEKIHNDGENKIKKKLRLNIMYMSYLNSRTTFLEIHV